jgi:hypothetical protein
MAHSRFKAGLIWLHKWLGVALCLVFAMWFASGIVLYFVPFPTLSEGDRLAGLPAIELDSDCCLDADEAARRSGLEVQAARLGMYAGRPVWRVLAASADRPFDRTHRWQTLDARTGALLPVLDASQAAALAEAFSGRRSRAVEPLERDQWTVAQDLNPYRPLYKVRLAPGVQGDDGLELYVSAHGAEVVRDTRRVERFWNWLGAVPHWIYPTVLRQFPGAWHHVVVWLALPGVVLAVSGVVLGVWQLFLNPSRWIPYRKVWARWHHILGLVAAVFTFTWIFSGLLSMNPLGVFSTGKPDTAELRRWTGRPAAPALPISSAWRIAREQGWHPREIGMVNVGDQSWYLMRDASRRLLARADHGTSAAFDRLPDELMTGTLAGMRGPGPMQVDYLQTYDSQYYSRHPESPDSRWQRPLPIWRAAWNDGITIYADPGSGRILLRADRSRRWQRMLYNGLHSLDFAPLLERPRLRDTLVVELSVLGLAMCLTACVLAWRVVAPQRRRR